MFAWNTLLTTLSIPGCYLGDIENFTGVAGVPLGLAGPLRVNGEHAQGDFYVPLATTEGTLVASYNRGMRLLTECGGVKTTVVKQAMQRSPVFEFHDALEARNFGEWIETHFEEIKRAAESTTSVGKLTRITQYAVGPLLYLRYDYRPATRRAEHGGKGDACCLPMDPGESSGPAALFALGQRGH